MRNAYWLGVLGLTLSTTAMADEAGVEIGLRSGYGIPLGKGGNEDLKDVIGGNIPLWVDLGYRITPNIMVGGYFMYGFGFLPGSAGDTCDAAGIDCSVHNMRLGAQVHYHFMPWQDVDPWIGAGIGYEWITASVSGSAAGVSVEGTQTAHGFEFLNLQGGVDFMPSDSNFGIGPFVALSVAQITKISCSGAVSDIAASCNRDVDSSTHEWPTLGLRGTFVP